MARGGKGGGNCHCVVVLLAMCALIPFALRMVSADRTKSTKRLLCECSGAGDALPSRPSSRSLCPPRLAAAVGVVMGEVVHALSDAHRVWVRSQPALAL